jgi:putative membrane protein
MHFWGMHLFWWLFWLLIIIGFFVMMGPTPYGRARRLRTHRETPLETLQRRYANGDISTEEYEERKSIIEHDTNDARRGA